MWTRTADAQANGESVWTGGSWTCTLSCGAEIDMELIADESEARVLVTMPDGDDGDPVTVLMTPEHATKLAGLLENAAPALEHLPAA